MTSLKRVEANRINATLSTGPRSFEGKVVASRNALRHGLCAADPVIPGESAERWEQHRQGVFQSLRPVGYLEEELADRVASLLWRLRRVAAYEQGVTTNGIEAVDGEHYHAPKAPGNTADTSTTARRSSLADELRTGRQSLERYDRVVELLAGLDAAPQDAPLDGALVLESLRMAARGLPAESGGFDIEGAAFLASVGVPASDRNAPWRWPGWTNGGLRRAVGLLAEAGQVEAAELVDWAVREFKSAVSRIEKRIARQEEQAAHVEEQVRQERERLRRERLLMPAPAIETVTRYEAHLNRQMMQALHALERLQARRRGEAVAAPVAIDITVDAPHQAG